MALPFAIRTFAFIDVSVADLLYDVFTSGRSRGIEKSINLKAELQLLGRFDNLAMIFLVLLTTYLKTPEE